MRIAFDIEANGLVHNVTELWCIVTKDLDTQKVHVCSDYPFDNITDPLEIGIEILRNATTVYAHNGLGYDAPVLRKLYGMDLTDKLKDTFIASQLCYPKLESAKENPNQKHGHSIEYWGEKFGIPKVKNDDWSQFTQNILDRCIVDVDILEQIVTSVNGKFSKVPELKAIFQEEQEVYRIYSCHCTEVPVDQELLERYIKRLERLQEAIVTKISASIPMRYAKQPETPHKAFKKDMTITSATNKWAFDNDLPISAIKGDFTKLEYPNVNSTKQIVDWLLDSGWKPDTVTAAGASSLQGSSFKGVPERIHKLLNNNNILKHRLGLIRGLLNRSEDGILRPFAHTTGTNCVTGDTLIVSDRGLVPIIELGIGDQVLTHDGRYHRVDDKIVNGIKPIYNIRTSRGFTIRCTSNHPFYRGNEVFTKAKDLVIGDKVKVYGQEVQWADYHGYMVSNTGLIKGLDGKVMKVNPRVTLHDRAALDLIVNGTRSRKSVGDIILTSFVSNRPAGYEVCHKDGNPMNNNLLNLYWGTSQQNSDDAKLHGRLLRATRNRSNRKMTQEKLDELREELSKGYYIGFDSDMAKRFNVSRTLIGQIRRGKRWAAPKFMETNRYQEEFEDDTVVDIYISSPEPTYDITVKSAHSYVANQFVTHNTRRFEHKILVNLPRVGSKMGFPARAVIRPKPDHVLVGADASGLEARVEAHFTFPFDKGAYAAEILNGDIHQKNADALGISRQAAKPVKYGLTYGCGVAKLASMLDVTEEQARVAYDNFWDSNDSLKQLKQALERSVKRRAGHKNGRYNIRKGLDYIKTIDGSPIMVRGISSLINSLFQSAGSIIMKRAFILLDQKLKTVDPEARILIFMHDEFQISCRPEYADQVGQAAVESIIEAGKHFKLNVPLDGEYKIGRSWADTH